MLPKQLSGMGAIVDEAFAYRTVPETHDITGARHRLSNEGADLITFTSSSTVENFLDLKLPWPARNESGQHWADYVGDGARRAA